MPARASVAGLAGLAGMATMTSVAALAVDDFLPTAMLGGDAPTTIAACPLRPRQMSVKAARDFARLTVRNWGMDELLDDLRVVVSELVTNALRHALLLDASGRLPAGRRLPAVWDPRWPVDLRLLRAGSRLMCAVNDPSNDVPVRRQLDHAAESGRGLHLVESLSLSWGWTSLAQEGRAVGKAVWALFSLSRSELERGA